MAHSIINGLINSQDLNYLTNAYVDMVQNGNTEFELHSPYSELTINSAFLIFDNLELQNHHACIKRNSDLSWEYLRKQTAKGEYLRQNDGLLQSIQVLQACLQYEDVTLYSASYARSWARAIMAKLELIALQKLDGQLHNF